MEDRKVILFIEPRQEFRKAIVNTLERSGYRVITTRDGREALSTLPDNIVDLIISAVKMPNVNGFDLMQEINRTKIDVPVVFLTAYGDVESYLYLMNMGAFDYLDKPVKEQDLLRVTRNALAGRKTAQRISGNGR